MFENLMLLAGTTLEKGESAANAAVQGVTEAAEAAQSGGIGFQGIGGMLLYIVGLMALFYFIMIRPQRKKEKEMQNLQNAIKAGDWVMTTSGFYGKVVDVTQQVFIIEFGLNKGVQVPVRKNEIIGNKEPNLTNKPEEEKESK